MEDEESSSVSSSGDDSIPQEYDQPSTGEMFQMHKSTASYHMVRDIFCRLIGACFAFAHSSLYVQWDGLFGVDGLEPVGTFIQRGGISKEGSLHNLFGYQSSSGLDVDTFADLLCLTGFVSALLTVVAPSNTWTLATTWICYLSLYKVGQTFLSFQWDILLLETGFLAVLWAPWALPFIRGSRDTKSQSLSSPVVLWMIRFTLFKLMFMSGVVKIQANCPTWMKLTALEYHYATQCIPMPLAWYAHQIHPFFHQVSVATCLVIEIPLAFLIMAPFRQLRAYAGISQLLLQLLILLTGNYTFFNLLTMVLSLVCFDDQYLKYVTFGDSLLLVEVDEDSLTAADSPLNNDLAANDEEEIRWSWSQIDNFGLMLWLGRCFRYLENCKYSNKAFAAIFAGFLSWLYLTLFTLHSEEKISEMGVDKYRLTLNISVKDANELVDDYIPLVLIGFGIFITLVSLQDIGHRFMTVVCENSWSCKIGNFWKLVECSVVLTIALTIVLPSSAVTFVTISNRMRSLVPQHAFKIYENYHPYMVSSSYGLFRRMTGMGRNRHDEYGRHVSVIARPEIILEGSDDGGKSWKEIEFLYKPGNVSRRPPIVAPHQPRLDWQMWFAALGNYQGAPWFIHLVDKLLEGSQDTLSLIDKKSYPFKDSPPTLIRSRLFHYDFTRLDTEWNRRVKHTTILDESNAHQWWHRSKKGEEYTPPLQKRNPSVDSFLLQHGWDRPSASKKNKAARCSLGNKGKTFSFIGMSVRSRAVCRFVYQIRTMDLSIGTLNSMVYATLALRFFTGLLTNF